VTTRPLVDLAKTIRSKNAGVDQITFDVIFADRASYELVKRSGALSRSSVARLYGVPPERITAFVEYDPAPAIKFTIRRDRPSGSPGERDVFGEGVAALAAQQAQRRGEALAREETEHRADEALCATAGEGAADEEHPQARRQPQPSAC